MAISNRSHYRLEAAAAATRIARPLEKLAKHLGAQFPVIQLASVSL